MSKENAMQLDKLFGSKTRAKLLGLFFDNPEKSYYVREITRVIEEQINSVRRELNNLSSLGLVKTENYENKVYYSANMKHPFARPMTEIFARSVAMNYAKDGEQKIEEGALRFGKNMFAQWQILSPAYCYEPYSWSGWLGFARDWR